ncbi:WXG100 family type VII secretion target [Williamsia maris]|uniref:ESAT-6-like protein n=1 Tax=Williamsia maris TaxID=72806 RepID=A0ABT1H9C0_9NOCA|nr:WXG100 family type VII secretion target [Williamsia maris]MCP2174774.1 WXG100 family type VII secretion target [Williamsia maris]
MTQLSVTPEELTHASAGVRASADSLDKRIASLTSRVDSLLNGGWKGQAADAFRRDWEQWLQGAKDVVGGLDSTAGLLASSATSYRNQESANTSSIGQTGSQLNMEL